VAEVVAEAKRGLTLLNTPGEVVVSASGCSDATADIAAEAGAQVVLARLGKGNAIVAGIAAASGDLVCLIDADLRYFGEPPLVALLVQPILSGLADACVSDLYWRPIYPQMWLYGFFAPAAGALFPELVSKVGTTPWSGQRAALRHLWPSQLPEGFTADLALLLHWNTNADRLRPVLADDWTNPQRPKPELMAQELELLAEHAASNGRLSPERVPALRAWFGDVHKLMATYRPGVDDPRGFEQGLLLASMTELCRRLRVGDVPQPRHAGIHARPTMTAVRPCNLEYHAIDRQGVNGFDSGC
jgi:hypothetical protein